MAKANEINFDQMSLEDIVKLAQEANSKANAMKMARKQDGVDKVKKVMSDYFLTIQDLQAFGVIPKAGTKSAMTKEQADFDFDGNYWKLGQIGKTPAFVIKSLKDGKHLKDFIIDNKITVEQADEKEKKIKDSETYKA